MENLTIQIGDWVYTLPPKYLTYTKDEMCSIGVFYDETVPEDAIYLGLPFFQAFVTRFTYENATVSFGLGEPAANAGVTIESL